MFVPRPQTHQISRHYSSHDGMNSTTGNANATATGKKNKNKENTNAGLPTKTPSRAGVGKMLAPNTAAPGARTRVGLGPGGKSVGRDQAGGDKGKGKEVDDIGEPPHHLHHYPVSTASRLSGADSGVMCSGCGLTLSGKDPNGSLRRAP